MRYSKGEFTLVPNKSIRKGLPPTEQVVLMWLAEHSDDNDVCYPTRQTLAAECGITVRTLDRALASLVERKLIVKSARFNQSRQTSNTYEVVIVAPHSADIAREGDKFDTGRATKATRGRATKATHRTQPRMNSTQLTQVDTKVSTASAGYGDPTINELFEHWHKSFGYEIKTEVKKNRQMAKLLIDAHGVDRVKEVISFLPLLHSRQFTPAKAKPSDIKALYYGWNDVEVEGRAIRAQVEGRASRIAVIS